MIITIDGPTASGKSTTARDVARTLGYTYINSGLLYRIIAHVLVHVYSYQPNILATDISEEDITAIAKECNYSWSSTNNERLYYQGIDYTDIVKTRENDTLASLVGLNPQVRIFIISWIRRLSEQQSIVIDGRDAGTAIFPDAQFKFFLTASLQVRARRWLEDTDRGIRQYSLGEALQILDERDQRDQTRAYGPLQVPNDAYVIDSSDMSELEVVTTIIQRVLSE